MTTTINPPTTNQPIIAQVTVTMRLAKVEDFRIEAYQETGAVIEKKYKPNYGQQYWVKSIKTGEFDNRNYSISPDTDWGEIRTWLKLEMLYVPCSIYELQDAGLINPKNS